MEVSDIIALVNCVLTGLFLLATVASVVYAFKAYHHQRDRARKEAACELARYYAENIIQRHSFVTCVMQLAGLEETAKRLFSYDELIQFDKEEMLALLKKTDTEFEETENAFLQPKPQAIFDAKLMMCSSVREQRALIQEYIRPDESTGEKKLAYTVQLQTEFGEKVLDFLNSLEWFCMSCHYGIADEELLYQSLHQTFLSSVWLLYPYICMQNLSNEDKLFTNIIWLFDEWRDRLRDIQKKAQAERERAAEELYEAQRRMEEAEHAYQEAKPEVHEGKPLKK